MLQLLHRSSVVLSVWHFRPDSSPELLGSSLAAEPLAPYYLACSSSKRRWTILRGGFAQGSAARLEPCSTGGAPDRFARLTKALPICAETIAQPVEFTSLTGLPEVQRRSETLREDARSRQRHLLRVIFREKSPFFQVGLPKPRCLRVILS